MTERIWDKFLTEEDKAVFAASGYGAPGGFGKRPAILVIDVSIIFAAIALSRYWNRSSGGPTPAATAGRVWQASGDSRDRCQL